MKNPFIPLAALCALCSFSSCQTSSEQYSRAAMHRMQAYYDARRAGKSEAEAQKAGEAAEKAFWKKVSADDVGTAIYVLEGLSRHRDAPQVSAGHAAPQIAPPIPTLPSATHVEVK